MNKLVYDRTAEDVEYAKQHQSEASDLKGAYNYTDLNRIEEWCEYVANQLNTAGYKVDITTKTNWTNADMPTAEEMERIRSNVEALKNALNSFTNVPSSLNKMTYKKANDLEKVIEEVHDFIRGLNAFNIYSGVANSGQNMVWQNRFRHDYTPYTRISHIESTGTQWIDTGTPSQVNIRVQMLMELTQMFTLDETHIFGNEASGATRLCVKVAELGGWDLRQGSRTYTSNVDASINTTYFIDANWTNSNCSLKVNGTELIYSSNGNTNTGNINLRIFSTGASFPQNAKMKLYWCKMFLNNELVRNFIPVLDDDNVACLYDTVSEELFYNAGTGEFIGG